MVSKDNNSNWLSQGWQWTKDHTVNPLVASLLFGTAAGVGTRLLWGPAVETIRSLARPIAKATGHQRELEDAMDELKSGDVPARRRLPWIVGLLAAGGAASLAYNKRYEGKGLLSWNAPLVSDLSVYRMDTARPARYQRTTMVPPTLKKKAGLRKEAFGMESYVQQMDWNRRVPLSAAQGMFINDPYLPDRDRYSMNMGTAIVTDAAIRQHTQQPTLGGIFDSAASKIGNKLSLGGLADVGTKAMVANGTARLFTGAIGAVLGLGPKSRQTLVDAGTWAGTISAILN